MSFPVLADKKQSVAIAVNYLHFRSIKDPQRLVAVSTPELCQGNDAAIVWMPFMRSRWQIWIPRKPSPVRTASLCYSRKEYQR